MILEKIDILRILSFHLSSLLNLKLYIKKDMYQMLS